jgi:uncharacterized protein (DUF952 family)
VTATMDGMIYKLCSRAALAEARAKGRFEGSADDRRDGFIHFSSAEQLKGTPKHFAGEKDLALLAVDTQRLGESLQWEPSRGGAIFPHYLYAPLDLAAVLWAEPLPLDADGRPRLPARVMP